MSSFKPNPYNVGGRNPLQAWNGNRGFGGNPAGAGYPLDYDAGAGNPAIASFFNAVYGWMAAGVALTGFVAWFVSTRADLMASLLHGPTIIVLFLVELGLVFAISGAVHRLNATAATALFLLYAAINGVVLSTVFLLYTHTSITGAFVASAGMFGALSVYGMVTRTDLSRFGSILFMALIGLVIATVVNMFVASSALYWLVSYAGVLIFAGLTAYDTQRLRDVALATANDAAMAARLSVSGALMLYLDFINLFLFLLRIMGNRRN